ncbi:general secretion pathway protein GspE [Sorangium cellulosum]|uniref:General secretion pathway protein GspE n=1 Tax=Sorangium cellulosum TaxID=56 RepID=A0A150SAE5_SORCE|nr:general secretion pathway protein GspE [Sorangium cellulosum]
MSHSRPPASSSEDLDAVKVLDHLVRRAVSMGASDIHVEPKRDSIRVRYRVDGVMVAQGQIPINIGPSLASRVKVLARMDMTERRLPQDGQFSLELHGHPLIHLRASTFPAIHGETVVLRVLLSHQLIALEKLGLPEGDLPRVERLPDRPSGLIVVCGPTGSGKTSTLYSLLKVMKTGELSIVTLEDPIEVEFADITQGQTNPRQGFTFATGLRAILRQDPDVIMVGEMRDPETAQIALQASLTGHLVLSTLHTSDAVDTVARLVDLGAESWIVANALLAVIAQRLVRKLCDECAETYELESDVTGEEDKVLIEKGTELKRAVGCQTCHLTGYRGRIGLFEMLELDDDLRELVKARAGKRAYRDAARKVGLVPLREAGLTRVKEGVTSLDEVLRVT